MKNKIFTHSHDAATAEFLKNIPQLFESDGEMLFNKRNVIKKYHIKGRKDSVVVKRYKFPNLLQRIIYSYFKPTKALRAYKNGFELLKRNIETPHPIACMETYHHSRIGYCYYICEEDFKSPIETGLNTQPKFNENLAKSFARFAATLHEKGILNNDLNDTNVRYKCNEKGTFHFSLIDINRIRFFPSSQKISPAVCFENLTRFTGNMELHQYVIEQYLSYRAWPKEWLNTAVNIKRKHDKNYRRRKQFTRKLKTLFRIKRN